MLLVDSNVLIDVMTQDAQWCDWSMAHLRSQKARDKLTINHVIYAEISVAYDSVAELDSFLKPAGIAVSPISNQAAFLASRAFMRYRKARGVKTGVLPDFFIGAQAQSEGWTLLTRDATRYKRYFPNVVLISP